MNAPACTKARGRDPRSPVTVFASSISLSVGCCIPDFSTSSRTASLSVSGLRMWPLSAMLPITAWSRLVIIMWPQFTAGKYLCNGTAFKSSALSNTRSQLLFSGRDSQLLTAPILFLESPSFRRSWKRSKSAASEANDVALIKATPDVYFDRF